MSDSETHLFVFISCLLCARLGAEQGVTEKTRPGPPHGVSPNRGDGQEVGERLECGCHDGVGLGQEGTTQQAGQRRWGGIHLVPTWRSVGLEEGM